MKVLKSLGLIILFIAILAIIVPYFLPNRTSATAETEINASPTLIFRQVNELKNWENWSFNKEDTTLKHWYMGPDRGVDAMHYWEGENTERGTVVIIDSDPYKYIQYRSYLGADGSGSGGFGSWNFRETDNGVIVSWTVRLTNLKYFERWLGLVSGLLVKPQIVKGLNSLKIYTERLPEPYKVKRIIMDPTMAVVIYDSSTRVEMNTMFDKNRRELLSFAKRNKIDTPDKWFAIYHNWDPEGYTRISTGIFVDKEYNERGRVRNFVIPGGEAIFASYKGGYNTAEAHYAIDDYIKDFNLVVRGFIWETYLYDPDTEPDSTSWETMIYYPLEK